MRFSPFWGPRLFAAWVIRLCVRWRTHDLRKDTGGPKPDQGGSLDLREGAALGRCGFTPQGGSRKAEGLKRGKGPLPL